MRGGLNAGRIFPTGHLHGGTMVPGSTLQSAVSCNINFSIKKYTRYGVRTHEPSETNWPWPNYLLYYMYT